MIGERWARARRLATTIVRELGRGDAVTLLACDVTCREAPGRGAGPDRAHQVAAFLEGIVPEGGSDVAAGVEQGLARAAAESGAVRVVYIGDGTATVGPTQPAFLEHDVRGALDEHGGTVTVVPVGGDADVTALEAVAAAGRGVVVAHVPGRAALDTAYAVLGATYGHALSDVRVALPDGLVDVAPARLSTLPAGGEAFVVARMTRPTLQGTVKLSGSVGGEPFEQSYPLELAATTSKGNAFVPRLFAATQIVELERDGSKPARDRAVALSARYSVASRFTSLLVLESPAMFRAFGLDNQRRVATWTGDDEDESADADGEIVYESADDALGVGRLGTAYAPAPAAKRARKPKARRLSAPDPWDGPTSAAAPAAGASGASDRGAAKEEARGVLDFDEPPLPRRRPRPLPRPRRRRMVPMRKVWDRAGSVDASSVTPSDVDAGAIAEAERAAEGDLHRDALSRLYELYFRAGRLDDASQVAERWSAKDPLDAGALTARADVAAARGERDLAIRILGSVVDVRPGDHKAQWRLARLHRWAGNPKLGCRHSLAVSQIRPNDAKLLVEAVRCSRDTGQMALADRLLAATDEATRKQTEVLSKTPPPDPDALRGDLKLEATWEGGLDLDLALIHPDGHRVSWLGAPTRSVISARDVLSPRREGLALRGAKPGQYVIEVTRAGPSGPELRGTVEVTVGKTKKRLPFKLSGSVLRLGVAKVFMKSRLVPLNRPVAIPRAL
jgi:tetratricopeptide (TPR) repeat protein